MTPRPPVSTASLRSALLRTVAVAIAAAILILATTSGTASAAPDADPSSFALQAIQLINQERASRGLNELGYDARLFDASEDHTAWMVANNTFSHRGAGGSTPGDRALAAGYRYTALGESLARGHTSPQQVVLGRTCDRWCITSCDGTYHCDGWRQSPSHWNILMGSHYRDVGAAYLRGYSSRPNWWTVMVGNSSSPAVPIGSEPPPTATVSDPSPTPTPSRTPRPSDTPKVPAASHTPTRTPVPTRTPTRTPTKKAAAPPTATPVTSGVGSVSGRVLYGTAGPVAGAAIRVDGTVRGHAGPDGRFTISGIQAGRRVVEVRVSGGLWSRAKPTVVTGRLSNLGDTRLVPGDAYPSNEIDLLDLLIVASARGKCTGRSGYSLAVDVDRDGCIDDADFSIVYGSIGQRGPTGWTTSP